MLNLKKKLIPINNISCECDEEETKTASIGFFEHLFLQNRQIIISENRAIDPLMFGEVAQKLIILASISKEPIQIIMNNFGGELYSTLAIYDIIKECPCPVIIKCYGACMSGGSLLLQAADKRVFSPNCTMMIHDGSNGFSGTVENFQNWADESESKKAVIRKLYMNNMKGPAKVKAKVIDSLLKKDTILTAQEALKLGLIDEIE